MPLTKTTIAPPTNPDPVLSLPCIKMVVIVNDAALAQLADDLAQLPPIVDRQVIWFQSGLPAAYQATFNITNLPTAVAFSLKTDNTIADVIRVGESVDAVRMDSSYTNAGL